MDAVVLLSTFNEKANISELVSIMLSLDYSLYIIVVDDDSPDRTWQTVEEISVKYSQIELVRRMQNRGRGLAGKEGFRYILFKNCNFKYIIEMDADFSHNPKYIPVFLEAIKDADVVIGSRYLQGGRDERGLLRRYISKFAADCIRKCLQLNVTDPASGYRCFRREVLEGIEVDSLSSKDQFIIIEVLSRCYKKGYRIKEIPIVFSERKYGKSKLKIRTLFSYLFRLFLLGKNGNKKAY